jgi:hypothetical protein
MLSGFSLSDGYNFFGFGESCLEFAIILSYNILTFWQNFKDSKGGEDRRLGLT